MFNSLLLLMCAEKYVCVGKWCTLIREYTCIESDVLSNVLPSNSGGPISS